MYRKMNTNMPFGTNMPRQPLPMQDLPLHMQQQTRQPVQQPAQQSDMEPMTEEQMDTSPMRQMPISPGITSINMDQKENEPPVRFTDFDQLSMLSEGIPITTESLQYLNGFLRTQIGRRVKVEFLIGTNSFVDKEGTLLGVGVNYILINETDTDDLTACDFYNIKFIRFYF